jgi:hypothetical protein
VLGAGLAIAGGLATVALLMTQQKGGDVTATPSIISGTVHEPDGRPVVGARVYFVQGPVSLPDIALLTDDAGKFQMTAPVAGAYEIGINADGFAPATVTAQVMAGQAAAADITLTR